MAAAAGFTPEQTAQLSFLGSVLIENRTYLACTLTMLIYEYVITFKMEYERIWKNTTWQNWNVIKTLFVLNRYGVFGVSAHLMYAWYHHFSDAACQRFQHSEPFSVESIFIICEIIIALRVYAIYNRDKRVLAFLLCTLIAGAGLQIAAGYDNVGLGPFPPGAEQFHVFGCFPQKHPGKSWTWAYWLAPLLQSVCVIFLTVYKIIQYRRQGGNTPLLTILIRDGLTYFVIVFIINLVNLVYFVAPGVVTPAENSSLAFTITSIACTRLIFNMRSPEAIKHGQATTILGTTNNYKFSSPASAENSFKRRVASNQSEQNTGTVIVEMLSQDEKMSDDEKNYNEPRYHGVYMNKETTTKTTE